MARIKTVTEDNANEQQQQVLQQAKDQHGGVLPGIVQVILPDMNVAQHLMEIYSHLQFREESPLSRLQREMIGTVVNGHIDGEP